MNTLEYRCVSVGIRQRNCKKLAKQAEPVLYVLFIKSRIALDKTRALYYKDTIVLTRNSFSE